MTGKRRFNLRRWLGISALVFTGLCVILAGISALSNRNLPAAERDEFLSDLDKARLAEAIHLKNSLGDQVWPGWGSMDMPFIAWNSAYEFLVEADDAPSGWIPVPGDLYEGLPYFRRLANNPQNFAVPVGDAWAASLATKAEMDAFLIENFRETFPPPLKQVFPYRLVIQPTETQIGGLLHESFHVYQMRLAPDRLNAAEAVHRLGDKYEQNASAWRTEWRQESALLAEALQAKTTAEMEAKVMEFLDLREMRRDQHQLSADLIGYERWLEWEEGVAKYVEVAILRAAFQSPDYLPLDAMSSDPDFKRYQSFEQRWSQELTQLRFQTTAGVSQFYMTGMAQAFLLDELLPDWKSRIMDADIFLEDLLRLAVSDN